MQRHERAPGLKEHFSREAHKLLDVGELAVRGSAMNRVWVRTSQRNLEDRFQDCQLSLPRPPPRPLPPPKKKSLMCRAAKCAEHRGGCGVSAMHRRCLVVDVPSCCGHVGLSFGLEWRVCQQSTTRCLQCRNRAHVFSKDMQVEVVVRTMLYRVSLQAHERVHLPTPVLMTRGPRPLQHVAVSTPMMDTDCRRSPLDTNNELHNHKLRNA